MQWKDKFLFLILPKVILKGVLFKKNKSFTVMFQDDITRRKQNWIWNFPYRRIFLVDLIWINQWVCRQLYVAFGVCFVETPSKPICFMAICMSESYIMWYEFNFIRIWEPKNNTAVLQKYADIMSMFIKSGVAGNDSAYSSGIFLILLPDNKVLFPNNWGSYYFTCQLH